MDATDRSKISSDQKRLFFALSLYSLSFFANTPFKFQTILEHFQFKMNIFLSLDRPSRNSLKVELFKSLKEVLLGDLPTRAVPFITARFSLDGLAPNLSRILEQERKRSEFSPPRFRDVFALRQVCLWGRPTAVNVKRVVCKICNDTTHNR